VAEYRCTIEGRKAKAKAKVEAKTKALGSGLK